MYKIRVVSCAIAFSCLLLLRTELAAQGRSERREEVVKGRPNVTKVTYIFKKGRGKGGKKGKPKIQCTCSSPEGTGFKLEKAKWVDSSFTYTIWTGASGLEATCNGWRASLDETNSRLTTRWSGPWNLAEKR